MLIWKKSYLAFISFREIYSDLKTDYLQVMTTKNNEIIKLP